MGRQDHHCPIGENCRPGYKGYCSAHQTYCDLHDIGHLNTEPCVACERNALRLSQNPTQSSTQTLTPYTTSPPSSINSNSTSRFRWLNRRSRKRKGKGKKLYGKKR